jgi:hypothetical protein
MVRQFRRQLESDGGPKWHDGAAARIRRPAALWSDLLREQVGRGEPGGRDGQVPLVQAPAELGQQHGIAERDAMRAGMWETVPR